MSASMWFEFRTKGRSLIRPKTVSVSIGCSGREEILENLTGLALEIDNQAISLDQLMVGGIEYDLNAKKFLKRMHGSVPFDTFEKIVNGKSVKVHVAEVVFELSKDNRSALRDMLKVVR
jgi:hypothetical protein